MTAKGSPELEQVPSGPILDIHTHNTAASGAVISVRPRELDPQPGLLYSVGIHPWDTLEAGTEEVECLQAAARHPAVVAIGECGLDTLRGAPMERQIEITRIHIGLSESLGKPLILHCVRAYGELIMLHRRHRPRQQWVVHGFRGSAGAAASLLACGGINLSFGEKFSVKALEITPLGRVLVETDESRLPIDTIASRVAQLKGCAVADLEASRLFAPLSMVAGGHSVTSPHRE